MYRLVADEQAALRRLAMLVAQSVPPIEILDAVAREMGQILGVKHAAIARYESNGTEVTALGAWNYDWVMVSNAGSRWELEEGTVSELVYRRNAPGRIDAYDGSGDLATALRLGGIASSVGCPITIGRRLWGVAIASSTREPLPAGTEARMQGFTELAAVAVANAQSEADLKASRTRVVVASDQARRRIERYLHDGTQQRLVSIGLNLREIESMISSGQDELRERLDHVSHSLQEAVADLQELSRGVHPGILAKGGLAPALRVLARRSPIAVDLDISTDQKLTEQLEVTVYYIVSEALANSARHAHATVVSVELKVTAPLVRLTITDDGIGGADPAGGSGLLGLTDRVAAVGGRLDVVSRVGKGTTLAVEIPTEMPEDDTVAASPRDRRWSQR